MKLDLPNAETLRALLRDAAQAELIPRFNQVLQEIKADGSLVSDADRGAQRHVMESLRRVMPDIPLIGEESTAHETQALLAASDATFWCLDPLDGTTNFASGVPFYAVSLALIQNRRPILGAIYDPPHDEFFFARRDQGAFLNGTRLGVSPEHPALALKHGVGLVDLKRLSPALAHRLATQPPYASQRSFGSVALDWCWIAAGRGHVYVHGKQKVWDYAAGWLILQEAGGRSSTLDGAPVFDGSYADRSAVAARDPEVFAEWSAWLARAGAP